MKFFSEKDLEKITNFEVIDWGHKDVEDFGDIKIWTFFSKGMAHTIWLANLGRPLFTQAIAELEAHCKPKPKPLVLEEAKKMFPMITSIRVTTGFSEPGNKYCCKCKSSGCRSWEVAFEDSRRNEQYLFICQDCVDKWRAEQ